MKSKLSMLAVLALVAALVTAVPPLVRAVQDDADEEDDFKPITDPPPGKRTGGGARGGAPEGARADTATVLMLAPIDSCGLTGSAKPVIYWHLSEDTELPIVITVNQGKKNLLDMELKGPTKAGVHVINLGKVRQKGKPADVSLKPGLKYEIVVDLVRDPNQASRNSTATAPIQRVPETPALKGVAEEDDHAKQAKAFGKAGLWFDYLHSLNQAIADHEGDEALIAKRAKALEKQRLVWKSDGRITELPAEREPAAAVE